DAAGKPGHGGLERVELVENTGEVGDALGPNEREPGVVEGDRVAPGVEVSRLHYDEAARGPECGEGRVSVKRPPVAVREQHDGQIGAGGRGRDAHLERQCT